MIDLYCERLGPGLLAEPINALTNIAFFIAAWASWKITQSLQGIHYASYLLISLIIMIGTGSSLFHTFATPWAAQADIIPILLFQLCFVWFYSLKVMRLNYSKSAVLVIALFLASHFSRQYPNLLNGSLMYAPTLFAIAMLAVFHFRQQNNSPLILIWATAVFIASLFFRTIDNAICPYVVIGSHFLWHLCNGFLIYLTMKALFTNWPDQ
ncbi:ceramidase domain-containing protein [Endozoicomonas sp. SM1973]|uniref:Ceramidase domain-containing protein n=1 Tax=Spartinivicinus marinus TaxID=2994442 RepID=A0A853IDZ5_9GAMM|nr:ceramidase domain-containing protein [Spartinivicinus marinus]MCX4029322.1 ceramidase domain-containing protein [Spartinivicinus marinus]NYZ68161.1 ceramidase domain-containing protein [Spartinivicinus marinus]